MLDMDSRFGSPHPLHLAGSVGELVRELKGSQGRASSVKSADSLDRGHCSLSVGEDFELNPEDEEDQPKVDVAFIESCDHHVIIAGAQPILEGPA